MSYHPELLILDEPTNHLDRKNRKHLLQFLQHYPGTLLVASHDTQFLSVVPDCLWSICGGKIEQFSGRYEDFLYEKEIQHAQYNQQLSHLQKDKKAVHHQLMKEQKRAKNSKDKGKKSIQNRKWPTIVSHVKTQRASMTSGKKERQISDKREDIVTKIRALEHSEIIEPKFHLPSGLIAHKSVVLIKEGTIGYGDKIITDQINFQLFGQDRLAITGANGCGKSTLIKAMMNEPDVIRKED